MRPAQSSGQEPSNFTAVGRGPGLRLTGAVFDARRQRRVPAATASGQLGKVRKPPCCPTCGLIEAVAPSVVEHHHERRL